MYLALVLLLLSLSSPSSSTKKSHLILMTCMMCLKSCFVNLAFDLLSLSLSSPSSTKNTSPTPPHPPKKKKFFIHVLVLSTHFDRLNLNKQWAWYCFWKRPRCTLTVGALSMGVFWLTSYCICRKILFQEYLTKYIASMFF